MVMKGVLTIPRAPGLETYYQKQFCITLRTLAAGESYFAAEVMSMFASAPANRADLSIESEISISVHLTVYIHQICQLEQDYIYI